MFIKVRKYIYTEHDLTLLEMVFQLDVNLYNRSQFLTEDDWKNPKCHRLKSFLNDFQRLPMIWYYAKVAVFCTILCFWNYKISQLLLKLFFYEEFRIVGKSLGNLRTGYVLSFFTLAFSKSGKRNKL